MTSCRNVRIEQTLVNPSEANGLAQQATVSSVTSRPQQLYVVDINAKEAFLRNKGHTGEALKRRLTGIFANPLGGRADEVLEMDDFTSACVVAGGIYFSTNQENGVNRSKTDAFLFFKPDKGKEGRVIAPVNEGYKSGGFLAFNQNGKPKLIRLNDFGYKENTGQVCSRKQTNDCQPIENYRLIVQSNLILVAPNKDGKAANDGGLNATDRAARAALAVNAMAEASLVVTTDEVSLDEFANILLEMGMKIAINLDGGPSVQMARRTATGNVEQLVGWGKGHQPSKMPSLFVVQ